MILKQKNVFLGYLNFKKYKSDIFTIMFYYFFTVQKGHKFNQRSKILEIDIFILLKEKLSYDFLKILGDFFFTILVTTVAPQFFLHPHFSQFII